MSGIVMINLSGRVSGSLIVKFLGDVNLFAASVSTSLKAPYMCHYLW